MKIWTKIMTGALAATMMLQIGTATVFADSEPEYASYVSLGADLSQSDRATVLKLLNVSEDELNDKYKVGTVTNDDEYAYLSGYLEPSVIGTRALSSVRVDKTDSGSGIDVETHNISYCTSEMYKNALITAGVADASVVVAAPFNISGTSALVGTMRAYEEMTGQKITNDTKDAAVNELVVTGELSDSIGDSQSASDLIATLKDEVLSKGLSTDEEILTAIDKVAKQFDITLSEQDKQTLLDLLKKLASLDIDPDAIKAEAKKVADKLADMGVDVDGLWGTISRIFQGLIDWLKGVLA